MKPSIVQTITRRAFLERLAISTTTLAFVGCQRLDRQASPGTDFRLALISDIHIPADRTNGSRGFNPWENLRRTVPDLVAARPDGVVICGDVARLEGKIEDYREVLALIEPVAAVAPVYIGLGNHDDSANFSSVFKNQPGYHPSVPGKHITVVEHAVVRVIVLDSLLYANKVAGLLGRAPRNWLASYLSTISDRPVVLFFHHSLRDGDGDLLDADRLFALLSPHRHVKAIFYGHSHVWRIDRRQNLALINLPALAYNFKDSDPVGWVEARFRRDGVALDLRPLDARWEAQARPTFVLWS